MLTGKVWQTVGSRSARTALASGVISGFFGGLVGSGGGVIIVPLLTGWAKLRQHEAHGTSLVTVLFAGIIGAWVYGHQGAVEWIDALMLGASSTIAAPLVARLSPRVNALNLRRLFGYFLIITALSLPLKDHLPNLPHPEGLWAILVLPLSGLLVGSISGLLGIGGGTLLVPLLVLGVGLDQHVAQGTSLSAMVPAGFTGVWAHLRLGHVRKGILPALLFGTAVGSYLGGTTALALPGPTLRLIFAIGLTWLGIVYLRSARLVMPAQGEPSSEGQVIH